MAKEFKTVNELIALLESRGVSTDEETAAAIRREGYYSVVNGYKDTFLDRDMMRASCAGVYKTGTTTQLPSNLAFR